jgi:hypothetical protein
MGPKRTLSESVELTGLDILFELPVPSLRVVAYEPLSESDQLFWRELLDLSFDNFYLAHQGYSKKSVLVYPPRLIPARASGTRARS